MITLFTQHVTQGLGRLLAQFQGKENIEAVLTAFLTQIQELENMFDQLLNDRTIDSASGDVLDLIGRVVGQDRMGFDDTEYRLWLKARILINKSSGTAEEIIEALYLITQFTDPESFEVIENETDYPAYFSLIIHPALGTIDPQTIYDIINEMRSACVAFNLTYNITSPVFTLDAGPGLDQGHLAGQI